MTGLMNYRSEKLDQFFLLVCCVLDCVSDSFPALLKNPPNCTCEGTDSIPILLVMSLSLSEVTCPRSKIFFIKERQVDGLTWSEIRIQRRRGER